MAHKGLLAGEASSAIAAGVNLAVSATTTVAICQLQALSDVGRCKYGFAAHPPLTIHLIPNVR